MVTTIRVINGADTLEAEGLMLESMLMSYVRLGCKVEGCIVTISAVGVERGEAVCSVRPRSHKAGKAKGFGGKIGKVIKGVGRNNVREVRHEGRRRQGHISGIRCGISSI